MVQTGEQTRGTRSKNKNNLRIKAIRDAHAVAVNKRQKYTAGTRAIKHRE